MARPTKKIKKDAVVLTARQMLNGYVANNYDYNIYNMTPLQMIPHTEKDEDWKKWNMDWLERAGLRQLYKESRRLRKNYALANGILDKSDYIIGPENDMSDMISLIAKDNENTLPIKFYPLIPNVINVLVGEFSKRDNRIIVKAVDEQSMNEAFEYKQKLLLDILTKQAEVKKLEELQEMGLDAQSQDPEVQKQVQEQLDTAKQLATAETKFKTFRGVAEQWANHMIEVDNDRFDMYQKEIDGFRDMLVADREFWHIRVKEDDYELELWNPINTFYHKSPDVYYTSEGNYIGRIMVMSVPDIIDKYGSMMTEEQLLDLKNHYRTLNSFPIVTDGLRDQEMWYTNFSRPDGRTNVTWQKFMDGQVGNMLANPTSNNAFSWYDLNNNPSSINYDINGPGMVRVTEAYWKSQKRVGELTKIERDGTIIKDIVTEEFIVTEKPIYNQAIIKQKTKDNLLYGEHIDWIWVNEVRWGVKLNSSLSTYYTRNYSDFEPIYLCGDPIPFQFKGTGNLYGCKLPVEGKIFSERNSCSSGIVDKMKPHQINYNIVNNQIVEMLADEVGNVIVIDQNTIPRNSLKGQWGPYNFPMFHQIMKDYQIAAIDPSIRNTESNNSFSHFQQVDMSKTNQIATRLELARHFKDECFSLVGITPQRVGDVAASETATGTQQAVNNSYSQTEPLFDQHMNHLMPRVRQMMIEAAQYVNCNKPVSRLTYLNSNEENVFFDIQGDKLLLRDLQIRCKSTANIKAMMEQLKQLAMQNNTAGGTLYELSQMMVAKSPAEIIAKLKIAEDKRQQNMEAEQQHQMQMLQQQQAIQQEVEQKIMDNENYWREREIQKDIYIAEIKALGYAEDTDIDQSGIPDSLEVDKFLHQQGIDSNKQLLEQSKISLQERKLRSDEIMADKKMRLERDKLVSKEKIEKMKLRNPVSGEKKK